MIKQLLQFRQYLKASRVNGWFDQWQKSGDVISRNDRAKIQRETARHYIEKCKKLLSEGGK